ncbi:hypothetical protein [Parasitella parasitica]|uniref:USP domain-containing protein n=1 Tax=Parasitella parasitica TaxID=35722 RepID=A0A0B7NNT5_9FUNG|nr:hypothetical protein [Parasitella parasitica]
MYRKAVYQIPTENEHPKNSIALALQRLFYNLQFSNTAVSTTELSQSFGWDSYDLFMQRDIQEFNRFLQENVEEKVIDTPAEGTIKTIILGKIKSYIRIPKSERVIQGLHTGRYTKNENKYMAEGHGLQDAKKGVVFKTFPPVLQIPLKRFEYNMTKDTRVKFPPEIDLQPYHISRGPQNSQKSLKYILHGVLVHSGSINSGHYFAFVRPTAEDKRFQFNDDRVTPATFDEVFEDNYGGRSTCANYATSTIKMKETNAYMLVYIQKPFQRSILKPVTLKDIPHHLIQRIEQENRENNDRNQAMVPGHSRKGQRKFKAY